MDEPFGALDALTREQISMDIQTSLDGDAQDRVAHHPQHSRGRAAIGSRHRHQPAPGRIVEIIDIDLPRPRSLGRLPDQFNEYTDHIRHIFQTAGVLAFD